MIQAESDTNSSRKSLLVIAALILLITVVVVLIAANASRNGTQANNQAGSDNSTPTATTPTQKPGFSKVVISQTNLATKLKEGSTTDEVSISLQSQPTAEVVITLDANKQVTATPVKLTFTKDNWNKPQKFVLKAIDDAKKEDTTHYQTISFAVSSRDENYNNIVTSGVKVEIADKN